MLMKWLTGEHEHFYTANHLLKCQTHGKNYNFTFYICDECELLLILIGGQDELKEEKKTNPAVSMAFNVNYSKAKMEKDVEDIDIALALWSP